MALRTRAGYVYVMTNPALPGWFKVGRTQRPPHRRAKELSSAGIPQAFHVAFARFFWDCFDGERTIHHALQASGGHNVKRKEFFNLPLDTIIASVFNTPNPVRALAHGSSLGSDLDDEPWTDASHDPAWFTGSSGWPLRQEWAEETWSRGDAYSRADAWASLEKLSSEGYGEATWRLATWLLELRPTVQGAEQASWVFEAAEDQCIMGGRLRAAWLRSWSFADGLQAWYVALHQAWEQHGQSAPLTWPWHVVSTLEAEVASWGQNPQRWHDHPWWPALLTRWTQEKALAEAAWSEQQETLLQRLAPQGAKTRWATSALGGERKT